MASYEERLEIVPSDPESAASYPELLALWKQQRTHDDPDAAGLAEWDRRVMALLTVDERGYYLDETRLAGATPAAGKVNRLTGILLGRHQPPAVSRHARPQEGAPQAEVPDDRERPEAGAD